MTTLDDLSTRGRMPVCLDGWDDYSIWGWDGREQALFAQLWRNTDDSDAEPTVWITPWSRWPATTSPAVLAEYVAMATGRPVHEAAEALTKCAPQSVKASLLDAAA